MTPREAAEKAELEALIDYLGKRNFQHVGDAAEMKAAFEAAVNELEDTKAQLVAARAMIPDTPSL